jgi:hypothetical protein
MLQKEGWRIALSSGGRKGLPWSMERHGFESGFWAASRDVSGFSFACHSGRRRWPLRSRGLGIVEPLGGLYDFSLLQRWDPGEGVRAQSCC